MGIAQALGNAGITPGIYTSSTRPASPADGLVISETDTDSLKVYKGTQWAPVSGLTLISATAMTTGSVSVNNCFTSAYDNYRLLFSPSAVAANGAIYLRLRLSGTDSSANYTTSRLYGYGGSTASQANVDGTEEMLLGYVKSAAPQVTAISVDIFSPAQARSTVAFSSAGMMETATVTDGFVLVVYNAHTPATAYDGFTFLSSSGSNVTGTIYLYGYAKE
jgi:hypothetical protein